MIKNCVKSQELGQHFAVYEAAYNHLMAVAGGPTKVAEALNLSRQAVSKWRKGGIHHDHFDEIERLWGIPRWVQNPVRCRNPVGEIARWKAWFAAHDVNLSDVIAA